MGGNNGRGRGREREGKEGGREEKENRRERGEKERRLGKGLAAIISQTDEVISEEVRSCLLYTSPSPRDRTRSRMPSSA